MNYIGAKTQHYKKDVFELFTSKSETDPEWRVSSVAIHVIVLTP